MSVRDSTLKPKTIERLIWWSSDQKVPIERLIAQVMVFGTWEDILYAMQEFGVGAFVKVLDNPPCGLFDAKSWNFWHKKFGIIPVPPLPPQAVPWPLR